MSIDISTTSLSLKLTPISVLQRSKITLKKFDFIILIYILTAIMKIKKLLIYITILIFSIFIITPYSYGISKKLYSIPLLGLSILCGYGANYLYKLTDKKYDEAEAKFEEYMSLPEGTPNDIFEKKYEEYEDKYGEAESMRSYYYMSLGATILSFGAAVYFLFSKDENSSTALGYRYNYFAKKNDLYFIMKF